MFTFMRGRRHHSDNQWMGFGERGRSTGVLSGPSVKSRNERRSLRYTDTTCTRYLLVPDPFHPSGGGGKEGGGDRPRVCTDVGLKLVRLLLQDTTPSLKFFCPRVHWCSSARRGSEPDKCNSCSPGNVLCLFV